MKKFWIMLFVISGFSFAADLDTTTVEQLVTFREHELTYSTDTIWSVVNSQSSPILWYVKGINGQDYWSDKPPITLQQISIKEFVGTK